MAVQHAAAARVRRRVQSGQGPDLPRQQGVIVDSTITPTVGAGRLTSFGSESGLLLARQRPIEQRGTRGPRDKNKGPRPSRVVISLLVEAERNAAAGSD